MKKGKLIRNYIYNTLYQILVLLAPLITTPYVSRALGVTNIGIYQFSQSIAAYFVLIGAVGTSLYGQREIAYLQDKPRERSLAFWEIEIFRIVAVMVCCLVYTLIFCTHGSYPEIYMILTVEVAAAAFDISWLFMGMENFKLTVMRNSMIKLIGIVCIFIFVKDAGDLYIYTACVTFPVLLGNLSLWFSICKYLIKTNLKISELFRGIKKRVRPILVLFLPQIAADVYLLLDKTMIGKLAADIDQVGYYSQAQKIVKLLLTIVTSLGVVMMPAMSVSFAKGDHEGIQKNIRIAFRFIYMLSFALLFGLCAVAPRFVPFFFGDGYGPVVPLMLIISPILVIIATSNIIGKQYLLPTRKQKAFTISIISGAFVNFVLNLFLIPRWNAIGASVATVIAEMVVTVVQCIYSQKELPLKECLGSGVRYLIFGAVMYLACRGTGAMLPDGKVWAVGAMVIVGILVYGAELLITRDPMVKMAIGLVSRKHEG